MKLLDSIKSFFALLLEAAAEVNESSAKREQETESHLLEERELDSLLSGDEKW